MHSTHTFEGPVPRLNLTFAMLARLVRRHASSLTSIEVQQQKQTGRLKTSQFHDTQMRSCAISRAERTRLIL